MVEVDVRAGDPAVLLHHLNWRAAAAVIVAADVLAGQLGDADERAAQEEEAGGESVEQLEEKGRNTVEVTYMIYHILIIVSKCLQYILDITLLHPGKL